MILYREWRRGFQGFIISFFLGVVWADAARQDRNYKRNFSDRIKRTSNLVLLNLL